MRVYSRYNIIIIIFFSNLVLMCYRNKVHLKPFYLRVWSKPVSFFFCHLCPIPAISLCLLSCRHKRKVVESSLKWGESLLRSLSLDWCSHVKVSALFPHNPPCCHTQAVMAVRSPLLSFFPNTQTRGEEPLAQWNTSSGNHTGVMKVDSHSCPMSLVSFPELVIA